MESNESVRVEKDEAAEEEPVKEATTELGVEPSPLGVNGDKEMEADETSSEDNKDIGADEPKADQNDKEAESKKRKYDEMKDSDGSEDSSTNEFLGFAGAEPVEDTAKPSEEKKDKQDKTKSELLAFDSAFGKGKRSRIPNKKYEGLTLKSFTKSLKSDHVESDSGAEVTSSEDGRNDDESESQKLEDSSDLSNSTLASSRSKSSRSSAVASTQPPAKKQKTSHDMSNPAYRKPFEYGWKRELVYRAVSDNSSLRRNGDIYYITPSGKKVRSMREVSENLDNKELSLDDFTFFKEPIGLNDPEKEIIRDAKLKGSPHANLKKLTPKTRAAKEKSLAGAKAATPDTPATSKSGKSTKLGGFKVKFPGSPRLNQSSQKKSNRVSSDNQMDSSMLPPSWTSKRVSKQSTWQSKVGGGADPTLEPKTCNPCSIRCQGVSGLIPTLQCRLCLCLYHNECVGLAPHERTLPGYVCKNCQLDKPEAPELPVPIGPPPLTPISALISNTTHPTSPPKLQRIPRPGDTTFVPTPITQLPPRPQLLPRHADAPRAHGRAPPPPRYIKLSEPAPADATKSILGAVTTWFPPSSTIQMNPNLHEKSVAEGVSAPRPQGLVFMGERKFLVVPRTNVLSVSPALGAAASTPSAARITSPTADKAPVFEPKERAAAPAAAAATAVTPATASLGPIPDPADDSAPITLIPPVEQPPPEKRATSPPADAAKLPSTPTPAPTPARPPKDSAGDAPTGKARRSLARKSAGGGGAGATAAKGDADAKPPQNYLQSLCYGYQTLLHVFQYLKVQDLLRAGCVCTMWRDLAAHPSLWRTVRMKNSQVSSWEGLADALLRQRSEALDLRKVLLPVAGDDAWAPFLRALARVHSLLRIDLCKCPAAVVEELANTNRRLQVINAVSIQCESLGLATLGQLTSLQELRLKSTDGFVLRSDLTPLQQLTSLRHLSLTSVTDLHKHRLEVIGDLVQLESLDLGECTDFLDSFGSDVIAKLTRLERLRLEKGQGTCATFSILAAVSQLPGLEQLELVNFDVKAGFDKALGACANIKKLLIIPTYISQSATTNHMVLGGVIRLKATLAQFVWGVTLELLRVTELFVDQCEDAPAKERKKPTGIGDSIPVLKPVPTMKQPEAEADDAAGKEPPQVEILPLPTLQKLLLGCMPDTRVKILKIPFQATWRQSIGDTAN